MINENDRNILTKYRTGSHLLNIQKGRYNRVDRNNRLCICNAAVQDLEHVIFYCKLTERIRAVNFDFTNLNDFFEDLFNAPCILRAIERILDL